MIDFTPELRAKALENLKKYRWEETPFVPYVIPSEQRLGTILVGNTMGGVNWPGSSFNPETGIFYTQANNSSVTVGALSHDYFDKINPEAHTPNHLAIWEAPTSARPDSKRRRRAGMRAVTRRRAGGGGAADARQRVDRRPRRVSDHQAAVRRDYRDRHARRHDQMAGAAGDTPDAVRNSPLLKGMKIPKTGQSGIVGVVLTRSLVIVGDPQVTTAADRPRGAMLRAYDQQTGQEVGAVWMPSAQSGSPMTYMLDGRQDIVVAVGGGNYSGEYIAYALPQSEVARPTTNER